MPRSWGATTITTYIIQYHNGSDWRNFVAEDGSNVEFIAKNHAVFVAKAIANDNNYPGLVGYFWRIVDSHGTYWPLSERGLGAGQTRRYP